MNIIAKNTINVLVDLKRTEMKPIQNLNKMVKFEFL